MVDREEKVPLHACGPRNPEDSGSLTKMEKTEGLKVLTMKREQVWALEAFEFHVVQGTPEESQSLSLGGQGQGPADKQRQVPHMHSYSRTLTRAVRP